MWLNHKMRLDTEVMLKKSVMLKTKSFLPKQIQLIFYFNPGVLYEKKRGMELTPLSKVSVGCMEYYRSNPDAGDSHVGKTSQKCIFAT